VRFLLTLVILLTTMLTLQAGDTAPDWRPWPDGDPDYQVLYENDHVVGCYRLSTQQYFPSIGRRFPGNAVVWGPAITCPVSPPPRNFGLDRSKFRGGEHYTYNGEEIGKDEAAHLVGQPRSDGPKIPDNSKKLRVVIVADQHDKIVSEITSSPAFASYKDRCIVQGFLSTQWQIAGVGYAQGITVTDATGRQLLYEPNYTDAPTFVDALRKADPDYKPAPNPAPLPPLLPWLKCVPWSVWLLLGVAAVVLFFVFYARKL
jgi:hypothetical protein